MGLEIIPDEELRNIVGGEIFDTELFLGFVSIVAILIGILKLYLSEEGKLNFGKDYGFEWS